MEGLQRSAMSFRRQGSSGLVWDDKLLTRELNRLNERDAQTEHKDQEEVNDKLVKPINLERRTGQVAPAADPPSPRVSACGFCSAFRKSPAAGNRNRRAKQGKRATR